MTGYEHWRQVQPPCIDTGAQKDKIQTAEMELRRWVSSQTEFEKQTSFSKLGWYEGKILLLTWAHEPVICTHKSVSGYCRDVNGLK